MLTAGMQADIDQVTAAVAAVGDRPRTFYQIGSEPEIYAPAPGSFVADMVVAGRRRSDHDHATPTCSRSRSSSSSRRTRR